MFEKRITATVLAVVTCLTEAGCAGRTDVDVSPSAQSSQGSPVASPSPEGESPSAALPTLNGESALSLDVFEVPAGEFIDPAHCPKLLDKSSVARLQELPVDLLGLEYVRKTAEDGYALSRFAKNSDLVCGWGDEFGEVATMYAYGPISDDTAKRFKEEILASGAELVKDDSFERYTSPTGMPGGYAFGNGYWAYSLDNGGGDFLDEVIRNAPAF